VIVLQKTNKDTKRTRLLKVGDHEVETTLFRRRLIAWGRRNFRYFPWRLTSNPYSILMAEVMLHRTQAIQVVPVYKRFIDRFPDTVALSRANKSDLHEVLYSLGLNWRIDLIVEMARDLTTRFNGHIPLEKGDLLSLPGVSEYIASAVRCFAWNLPEPLIDTNTVRVIGRLFRLEIKESSRRNPIFRQLITALLDRKRPKEYNYALLDLANEICTKKRPPDCIRCPIQRSCAYGRHVLQFNKREG
jgi:A/G-specific adenine glycosylase